LAYLFADDTNEAKGDLPSIQQKKIQHSFHKTARIFERRAVFELLRGNDHGGLMLAYSFQLLSCNLGLFWLKTLLL
jgi:hypothetical protein